MSASKVQMSTLAMSPTMQPEDQLDRPENPQKIIEILKQYNSDLNSSTTELTKITLKAIEISCKLLADNETTKHKMEELQKKVDELQTTNRKLERKLSKSISTNIHQAGMMNQLRSKTKKQ